MKKIIISLLLLFPLFAMAQKDAAVILDNVVAAIKADAALQMDYTYTIFDEEGAVVYSDNGTMTQWSYMKDIDEVYITAAGSDEAQNLSPLYIMETYRENYSLEIRPGTDNLHIVTLTAHDVEAEVNKLELLVNSETSRLAAMFIHMPGQGYAAVQLDNYVPGCKFASATYECPVGDFPTAEVIDMR